jgi:hypothetical protein
VGGPGASDIRGRSWSGSGIDAASTEEEAAAFRGFFDGYFPSRLWLGSGGSLQTHPQGLPRPRMASDEPGSEQTRLE